MAVFKCKMCGGSLEVQEGSTVCECEYCGSKQTIPQLDNEKKINLFARAGRLRSACEFDKAAGVYENIVSEFPEEAEAYWGLLLCKYGIEYVDDPKTGKKIPTCHRSSFDSIMEDADFEMVMECSDSIARALYREEAKVIEGLRTRINEISSKEDPYDIFICYKETDATGNRTLDSVIAQDVYEALTEKGYKVFFSRITLEDKLGQEYEPYIFAALNSAKVMLAFGTDYEYFNAVWVKNEWSRFLGLIEKGEKKTLIPCYKGIDAYDMPKEFARLQAQDMGKVGAIQDLLRGIEKILGPKLEENSSKSKNVNIEASVLVQRGNMALEDGDFNDADTFFDRALDINPHEARAWLGKFMANSEISSLADMQNRVLQLDNNKMFCRAEQFADAILKKELNDVKEKNDLRAARLMFLRLLKSHLNTKKKLINENARLTGIYNNAVSAMKAADSETAYKEAAATFRTISGFGDADALAEQCLERAKGCRKIEVDNAKSIAAAIKAGNKAKNDTVLEEKLAAANARIESLTSLQNEFDTLLMQASQLQEEQIAVENQAANLNAQRSKLGLFAGKEKRRIDEELSALNARGDRIVELIRQNEEQRHGFNSKENVDQEIAKETATVTEIEAQIASKRASEERTCDYEEAIKAYLGEPKMTRAVNDIFPAAPIVLFLQGKTNSISFGRFTQEKNGTPEPIEWQVLSREKDRVLVISKYALDRQAYDTSFERVITWDICSLRKWLNDSFLNVAFSESERAMIPSVTVSADKNPNVSLNPGKSTTDKVFLLSIAEVNKYFGSDEARKCTPTAYAMPKGKQTRNDCQVDGVETCSWWLRSPGLIYGVAASVNSDGSVCGKGSNIRHYDAVRPAMWIDISNR